MVRHYQLLEYIPFFSVLANVKNLDQIKDITSLLNVVAFELQNPKPFLLEFPLTKDEKKRIQILLALQNDLLDDRLILYRFGAEVLYQRQLLQCFYRNEKFEYELPTMTINRRADLALRPKEVMKLLKKPPGPWVGKLFAEIEEAIILEKIENTSQSILKFIKERGIFHVKED